MKSTNTNNNDNNNVIIFFIQANSYHRMLSSLHLRSNVPSDECSY